MRVVVWWAERSERATTSINTKISFIFSRAPPNSFRKASGNYYQSRIIMAIEMLKMVKFTQNRQFSNLVGVFMVILSFETSFFVKIRPKFTILILKTL